MKKGTLIGFSTTALALLFGFKCANKELETQSTVKEYKEGLKSNDPSFSHTNKWNFEHWDVNSIESWFGKSISNITEEELDSELSAIDCTIGRFKERIKSAERRASHIYTTSEEFSPSEKEIMHLECDMKRFEDMKHYINIMLSKLN